jgi:hypothetical protein
MKIGRNDPCPCGSGKKYKKCCFEKDEVPKKKHQFKKIESPKISGLFDKIGPKDKLK